MGLMYNIYCDESCHLENDRQKVMVLGAVWSQKDKTREIFARLREIKMKHGLSPHYEVKWTKVSPSKIEFFQAYLDYFFDEGDLHFRGLIVPDKSVLDHAARQQSHDDWYYKMFFTLLKTILNPEDHYQIYFDIKDSRSQKKIDKLHEILCSAKFDFQREIISKLQLVRSHEVELIQLADFLTGLVSYENRELSGSEAKLALIRRMKMRSGYSLKRSTLIRELKVNLLRWMSQEELNEF